MFEACARLRYARFSSTSRFSSYRAQHGYREHVLMQCNFDYWQSVEIHRGEPDRDTNNRLCGVRRNKPAAITNHNPVSGQRFALIVMNLVDVLLAVLSTCVLAYTAYDALLVIFAYIMLGVLIVTTLRMLGPYVDPVLFPFPCSPELMRDTYELLIKSVWYLACAALANYAAGRAGEKCAESGWRVGCARFVLAASMLCNMSSHWRATPTLTYPMMFLPVLYIIDMLARAPCFCASMHIAALFFIDRYVSTAMRYGWNAIVLASLCRRALVSAMLVLVWIAMMYYAYRAGLFDVRIGKVMPCGGQPRPRWDIGVVLVVLGDISGRMIGRAIITACLQRQ